MLVVLLDYVTVPFLASSVQLFLELSGHFALFLRQVVVSGSSAMVSSSTAR